MDRPAVIFQKKTDNLILLIELKDELINRSDFDIINVIEDGSILLLSSHFQEYFKNLGLWFSTKFNNIKINFSELPENIQKGHLFDIPYWINKQGKKMDQEKVKNIIVKYAYPFLSKRGYYPVGDCIGDIIPGNPTRDSIKKVLTRMDIDIYAEMKKSELLSVSTFDESCNSFIKMRNDIAHGINRPRIGLIRVKEYIEQFVKVTEFIELKVDEKIENLKQSLS